MNIITEKWSTEMLNTYLSKIMDERDRGYQQRWEAQQKAVNDALNAAEKAVSTALIAQEKAVANAFNAQEKAVASALSAAEKAVAKAEASSEKRFDNLNEKIDSNAKGLDRGFGRIDDLREYKDTSSGKASGFNAGWGYLVALVSTVAALYLVFKG